MPWHFDGSNKKTTNLNLKSKLIKSRDNQPHKGLNLVKLRGDQTHEILNLNELLKPY
jgi:hypothetical protein